MRVMMVRPGFPKGCEAQIGTRIICKWILTTPLLLMTMVGMKVDLVKKRRSALKGLPETSNSIWGLEYQMHPKPWRAFMLDWNSNSKCLEGNDVGLMQM